MNASRSLNRAVLRIHEIERGGYDADGPIFPYGTPFDREIVDEVVARHQLTIRRVTGEPFSEVEDRGIVVAIGSDASEAAALHAALTGRVARTIEPDDQLPGGAAVIVTTYGFLDTQTFGNLSCLDRPAGIIVAGSDVQLRRRVLRAVMLAWIVDWAEVECSLYARTPQGHHRLAGREVIGGNSEPERIRRGLSAGAGLVTLVSHADGVDAKLGGGLILCSEPWTRGTSSKKAARCDLTSYCSRLGAPLNEARHSDRLVFSSEVSAGVLVLDVCYGALPADGAISPQFGFLERLLNADVGAIITTCEIVDTDPGALEPLLGALRVGATLSEAVRRYDVAAFRDDGTRHRLFIFGEPSMRALVAPDADGRSVTRPHHRSARSAGQLIEVSLARHALRRVAIEEKESVAALGANAMASLEMYEDGTVTGADETALLARYHDRLLELLFALPRLEYWRVFASIHGSEQAPCFVCGRDAVYRTFGFHDLPVERRRRAICTVCGIICDQPESMQATFSLVDDLVTIDSACSAATTVAVHAYSWLRSESVGMRLPAGRTASHLPEPLPAGPVRLSVFLLDGVRLGILSATVSAERPVRVTADNVRMTAASGAAVMQTSRDGVARFSLQQTSLDERSKYER